METKPSHGKQGLYEEKTIRLFKPSFENQRQVSKNLTTKT